MLQTPSPDKIPDIRATYDRLTAAAIRHTVGGILTEPDIKGITRRLSQIHAMTAEAAAIWVKEQGGK